jgi:hypothetical protein
MVTARRELRGLRQQPDRNRTETVDGKTILLENRFPNEQPERFLSLAAELVALKVDVLVAVTQPAALAAQRATTTIPIVFILVPEPVESKLVNSFSRPGGNITGLTQIAVELSGKRLELLKEAFPRMTRVLLVNPSDPQAMQRYVGETKTAATSLGIDVQPMEVRSVEDFEQAFDRMVEGHLEGIIVTANGLFYQGPDTDELGHAAGHLIGGLTINRPQYRRRVKQVRSAHARARRSRAPPRPLFFLRIRLAAKLAWSAAAAPERSELRGRRRRPRDRTRMAMAKEEKSRGLYRGGSAQCAAPALPGQS